MEKNTDFIPLYKDRVFIDIFGRKNNIKFAEYLLECLLGLEENSLKDKLNVRFETIVNREFKDRTSRCDLIFTYDKTVVNIECYKNFSQVSFEKSAKYLATLSYQVLVKEDSVYNNLVQINLIKYLHMTLPESLVDNQINVPLSNYIDMENLRLDQIGKNEYNLSNLRKEDLLAFLRYINASSNEERQKIAKERSVLMALNKVVEDYFNDGLKREDFDYEENLKKAAYSVGKKDGEKSGYEKGEKFGKKQGMLEIAKNMLLNNEPMKKIIQYTNLTAKEIKNIIL